MVALSLCGTGVPFFSLRFSLGSRLGLHSWITKKSLVLHQQRCPHAVPLRIEDCKVVVAALVTVENRSRACFINRVVVATGSLSQIELDDLAVVTKGPSCGNQMPGKEDRLRTSNYMYSWVLLHMVMCPLPCLQASCLL